MNANAKELHERGGLTEEQAVAVVAMGVFAPPPLRNSPDQREQTGDATKGKRSRHGLNGNQPFRAVVGALIFAVPIALVSVMLAIPHSPVLVHKTLPDASPVAVATLYPVATASAATLPAPVAHSSGRLPSALLVRPVPSTTRAAAPEPIWYIPYLVFPSSVPPSARPTPSSSPVPLVPVQRPQPQSKPSPQPTLLPTPAPTPTPQSTPSPLGPVSDDQIGGIAVM